MRASCRGVLPRSWARGAVLPVLAALLLSCSGGDGGSDPEEPHALAIEHASPPVSMLGVPFSLTLTAVGGSLSDYTWQLVDEALPAGLGLSVPGACPVRAPFERIGTLDTTLGAGLLAEVSGLASSRLNVGVLWAIDDGGKPSDLYALDRSGALRQRYRLETANVDWEDLAIGPGPDAGKEYLYIADVGDNGSRRTDVRLIRVEEPLVPSEPGETQTLAHQVFHFAWPGGPRDCETLLLDWASGTPYLVEKRSGGADAYKFPMPLDPDRTTANPVQLLAVTSGFPLPSDLTAGDASRDGQGLTLRSYGLTGREYRRLPGERFDDLFESTPCPVLFSLFQQYEALAYGPGGLELITTTEKTIFPTAPILAGAAMWAGGEVVLQGVPTARGTFRLALTLQDGAGQHVDLELDIVVR